jgi:hypothetical protein
MEMAVFWIVVACRSVEVYRRFTGACCLHRIIAALVLEAVSTSETSADFCQTALRSITEDRHHRSFPVICSFFLSIRRTF